MVDRILHCMLDRLDLCSFFENLLACSRCKPCASMQKLLNSKTDESELRKSEQKKKKCRKEWQSCVSYFCIILFMLDMLFLINEQRKEARKKKLVVCCNLFDYRSKLPSLCHGLSLSEIPSKNCILGKILFSSPFFPSSSSF